MKYHTKAIKSLPDLIKALNRHIRDIQEPIWYRGHANKTWRLESYFERLSDTKSEKDLINQFKQKANLILEKAPNNEFDWLFLMQHYGIPTRLLDWSENPLVALYFVVKEFPNDDGALWMLLPLKLNLISDPNSDPNYLPSFEDGELDNYTPTSYSGESGSSLRPRAAIAVRNNPRMAAQLSVFTIHHRSPPIENLGDRKHVWKYIIPSTCKNNIEEELKKVSINEFTLFPELDKLKSTIKW